MLHDVEPVLWSPGRQLLSPYTLERVLHQRSHPSEQPAHGREEEIQAAVKTRRGQEQASRRRCQGGVPEVGRLGACTAVLVTLVEKLWREVGL